MKRNKGSALIMAMGVILLLGIISLGIYGIFGYNANLENARINKEIIKLNLINQLYDELNEGLDGDGYLVVEDYYRFTKTEKNYTYFMDVSFDILGNYTIIKEGFL
jgi:hypothetical protein